MIIQLLWLIIGFIVGSFIFGFIGYQLGSNATTSICSECGYRTKNKNIRKCPKCGNPLK